MNRWLAELRVDNLRLLRQVALSTPAQLNFIIGPNAAGKTSLLEAIYVLGRGKSFRGAEQQDLLGPAGTQWAVQGVVRRPDAPPQALTVRWTGETDARIGGEATSAAELAYSFPVQVLDPAGHRLLEEGPAYRRKYLDWGVFHVEPSFYPLWRRYQRGLRQRNRALKAGGALGDARAWDRELAETGEALHRLRLSHLEGLQKALGPLMAMLLDETGWTLELHRGWPGQEDLQASLVAHWERDQRLGQTMEGPHRAELRLRVAGRGVKHRVSRGQQKLLVAALLLAQARMIEAHTGFAPVLLIDDFPAELGAGFQARLLEALRASGCQTFLTALSLQPEQRRADEGMFHVEQGALHPAF